MGFQHGLSGLGASSRNLDVIGHNIANANTVGAKSSRAEFADVFASARGSGSSFSGLGVQVAQVTQQFSQGDLTSSNNPLDMAVNGAGFFRIQNEVGEVSYTRNGQFKLDNQGFVVSGNGHRLTGYPVDLNGEVQPAAAQPIRISSADIEPKQTETLRAVMNLDTRDEVPTVAFDIQDTESYNSATSLDVFDQQGRDTSLSMFFRKTADNQWDIYAAADGVAIGAAPVGQLTFGADGRLDPVASPQPIAITVPTAAGVDIALEADLGQVVQFGAGFGVNELEQDGFTTGRLSGFNIEADGKVQARYTNGESRSQGQIALTDFANPQGLVSVGGNAWIESSQSGTPVVGAPGTGALGGIQSGTLEQSNVDLTGELVSMIIAQRSYQANAQTVKAQDQILQTIVNLR